MIDPPPPIRPSVNPTSAPDRMARRGAKKIIALPESRRSRVKESLGGGEPFPALEHSVPIDEREPLRLEQPRKARGALSIEKPFWEGRKELAVIPEFGEYDAAAFDRQRAGTVAVIDGPRVLPIENGEDILGHD